jgi:hypothetical protein
MSDSIHTTSKDLRNLTKREIDEMSDDPNSVLRQFGKKSLLKKNVTKERKAKKANL